MNKNLQVKSKSGLVKGTALAFAAVMSVACFPGIAIANTESASADIANNTIVLTPAGDSTAIVGSTYQIAPAHFGSASGAEVTNIKVTYKSTGENVAVTGKAFEVANVGTYNICYIYEDGGMQYTLDYEVVAVRSNATLSFEANQDAVLPSVYDLNYDKAKSGENYKDVLLPLPTVYDEDEEEIENVKYYTNATKASVTASDYVVVSVKDPKGNDVGLTETDGKISIPGSVFGKTNVEIGEYTITYAYYAKKPGATDQCIKTTDKSFSLKKGYYVDYELKANIGSLPTFITGVETAIPAATATASFKNSVGASTTEEVNVKYEASVKYKNGENWEDVENAIVDGKFKPAKDGEYRITYKVTDFYGNTAESKSITLNISDTKAPEVFMYDASAKENYKDNNLSKAISEYVDASSKLKTKTENTNVVIYAIGATDNSSALDNLTLTRRIRKSDSATIEVKEYNAYNLIFNYDLTRLSSTDLLGRALSGKTEAEANEWLKANKFLKVITKEDYATLKTVLADDSITKANADEKAEAKKADLVNAGYAYITATHKIEKGTYTVRYIAKDEAGLETTSEAYTLTIEDSAVNPAGAPKVSTTTKFANSYTSKDVIEFAQPTATDEIDSRMDIVTTYSFLKSDRSTQTGKVVTIDKEYKIDIAKAIEEAGAENPAYLVINIEATNDFGEKGVDKRIITISDINDTKVPEVKSTKLGNVEITTPNLGSFEQNSQVELPTIVYEDDYVAVMSAKVKVFLLDSTGKRLKEIETLPGNSSYTPFGTKTFTFNAGKVVPAYGNSKYEVMVVAKDPANNIISTYYYFTATSTEQDFFKLNVPSSINGNGTATVGDTVTLEVPSITSSLANNASGNRELYGVSKDGTATMFSVDVQGPAYEKVNEMAYKFTKAGSYTFKYKAYFAVYDSDLLKADANGVYYQADASSPKYYADSSDYSSLAENIRKALDDAKMKVRESDEYTLVVSENASSKTFEINYGSSQGYSSSYKLNEEISIFSAGATGDVDTDKSIITITDPDGSTKNIKLSEFATATDTIKYKFTKNGVYTITYKIVDNNGVEYSSKTGSKTFSIKVGDAEKPEINLKEDFLKDEYNLNDTLTLDISKIVLSDNGYGTGDTEQDTAKREQLLSKMKVVLTRVDDNNNTAEIENIAEGENAYSYKLENAGTYTLKITVEDAVGLKKEVTKTFEVSTEGKKAGVSTKTVGIILIVLACLVLAGVIAYFVISRVRMNKRGKKLVRKDDKKKESK